jgi:hypothetical protein
MNAPAREFLVIWNAQGQLIMSTVHTSIDETITALEWLRLAYASETLGGIDEEDLDKDLNEYLDGPQVWIEAVLHGPVKFVDV